MKTSDFDYNLPEGLIAQNPQVPRDHSRLLVYDSVRDEVYHKFFFNIIDYLSESDLLVLNRSKVIPARIRLASNRELFILKSLGNHCWHVMVRPGKFFKLGRVFDLPGGFNGVVREILDDGTRVVETEANLLTLGSTPLPPYIKRSLASEDQYQTVYAKEAGSVAAPTAGLHFTDELIVEMKNKGVQFCELVLHVGRGTFLPVAGEDLEDHLMHKEEYFVDERNSNILLKNLAAGNRVVAVGTTSVRVLESAFGHGFKSGSFDTDIFIYPGAHDWNVVDALITNFHLPKSTLLMLVSSFLEHKGAKDPIKKCKSLYELAISMDYRFYSFGDAMLII